ncbi:hypothetical protein PybrP1_002438 [[Pythium] brassicae (nom. inval.)]|nr:hypothetical protein PybrP1_002438 [[Pythium] brassicae (nom. inval.)]
MGTSVFAVSERPREAFTTTTAGWRVFKLCEPICASVVSYHHKTLRALPRQTRTRGFRSLLVLCRAATAHRFGMRISSRSLHLFVLIFAEDVGLDIYSLTHNTCLSLDLPMVLSYEIETCLVRRDEGHAQLVIDGYGGRRNRTFKQFKCPFQDVPTERKPARVQQGIGPLQRQAEGTTSSDTKRVPADGYRHARHLHQKQTKRRDSLGEISPIQAFVDELAVHSYSYPIKLDSTNDVTQVCFSQLLALALLRNLDEVLLRGATYKTNRFKMSLLVYTGVMPTNQSFIRCAIFMAG